ncbi:relaxase/mobilization nuclease domain-containing protein [Pedobacter sp. JCM 36344]|uniref:relaxase/mobilization nuclease domain-containing protein n=1 Tax=Pedobacter sp. JCM 36344 TaxID=3374280 RepID=UPI00397D8FAE
MIGKIIAGKNFGGCIRYVVQKQGAEVLYGEGIRLEDTAKMTRDFNMQRLLNPDLEKAVAHISLNFSTRDEDKLGNEMMVKLAKEYLEKMNIRNTQVLIVKHNDAKHPHCHIIYNRVDNIGKTISDSFQKRKNVTVCKEMTLKHGLYISEGKDKVNRLALKGTDRAKYLMYDAIKAASQTSKNWKQFEKQLSEKGIEIKFKYAGQTDKAQGVSFKMGEYAFKGSEIDRSLSFGKLDKTFEINSVVEKAVKNEWVTKEQSKNIVTELLKAVADNRSTESLLEMLLEPTIDIAPNPAPFLHKKKKHEQDHSQGISI